MNTFSHNLVVIGAGPGGYAAAIRAAQLGLNTACVEKAPALGGTCLRIGCIPSKALLESSERFLEAQQDLARHGVKVNGVQLDLAAMMKRKADIVSMLTKGVEALFKKNQIARYTGTGRIAGPGRILVEGGAEPVELQAKHILIATGSRPASLPGLQWDGDVIGTSTEALGYPSVPGHLVVIGAGFIGLELGSVWRRLGAQVTVLEFLDRILPGIDGEIAAEAQKLFARQGIEFRLKTRVTSARRVGGGCVVECEGAEPIACDRVLVAVGRVPCTTGLGLESVGIATDPRGFIPINLEFATSAPGIHAIGDVVGGPLLAHKAAEEGVACAEIIAGGRGHVNYETVPGVVYTNPEIGAVGRTEEQLRESGQAFRKGVFPFRASGRARAIGQVEGRVKVLADAQTDRLLGVHILGPQAGELINEAAAAMHLGGRSADLARVCHAHPTLAEALKEAALAVEGRAIHV